MLDSLENLPKGIKEVLSDWWCPVCGGELRYCGTTSLYPLYQDFDCCNGHSFSMRKDAFQGQEKLKKVFEEEILRTEG